MAFIRSRKPVRIAACTAGEALRRAGELGCAGPPFDAERLLLRMGCTVERRDLDHLAGVLDRSEASWRCQINQYQNRRRQNFALAHQLAHILLHADAPPCPHADQLLLRSRMQLGLDLEAADFACSLLVPEEILQTQISQGRRRLTVLADWFGVPLDAMRWRALRLGMMPAF